MECGTENHNQEMADIQDECNDSRQQQNKCQDLDDIDVEAILSRAHCYSRRRQPLYEAPEFVKRLNNFEEVNVGSDVVFACQWRALPKPTVKWYKDDDEITENSRYKFQLVDNNVEEMVIENCKRKDEGAYKCKAENQEGVASTTGYLSVTGKDPGEPTAPPHSQSEHSISVAPPRGLKTIVEQKSLEEREEEEYSQLPPSPIQDFIDNFAARRTQSWPYAQLGYTPEDFASTEHGKAEDSESDTSVESQDYDRVSFEARAAEADLDVELCDIQLPLLDTEHLRSEKSAAIEGSSETRTVPAPFSSSESDNSSSDVSIPDLCVESVGKERRRPPRKLGLQRTTALEEHEHTPQDDNNKTTAAKAPPLTDENTGEPKPVKPSPAKTAVRDFTVAKVSTVSLASFTPDNTNKDFINGRIKKTSEEKHGSGSEPPISSSLVSSKAPSKTIQGVLEMNFVDILETVLDSPLLYYMLFTCCCGFWGMVTDIPIPLYVLVISLLAMVSFRILLHHTAHKS